MMKQIIVSRATGLNRIKYTGISGIDRNLLNQELSNYLRSSLNPYATTDLKPSSRLKLDLK